MKVKPQFVNLSSRPIDLRTGPDARLALAVYAPATKRRTWISPVHPRYRQHGHWLLVPPNAPGQLHSTQMFETHWERTRLKPYGKYSDPDRYEGDLVFNIPPDLTLTRYNVRLAYRLNSGGLYFPSNGAVGQWRGHEDGYNF